MESFKKPLTAKEEKDILDAYRAGDTAARNVLVLRNMRLVAHIVKKYSLSDEQTADLMSVGTIGLIKAIDSYNPDKNIRLATYAARCIDNEILMLLRARRKISREVSWYDPIGKDKEGNELSIYDTVKEDAVDIVEDMVFNQRVRLISDNFENVLNERERSIINMRYGLMCGRIYTQNEIAKLLGISRSYVSRIEKRALTKLRRLIEDNGL